MTDDLIQLASTYLDGQATAAERARVESDPELLAEVDRLREVRAVLADTDTDTAPISVRERHLAAALDTWDRLSLGTAGDGLHTADGAGRSGDAAGAAGTAAISSPSSLSEQRRKRRAIRPRILTAAAAIIVVGGAGFVIQDGLGSNDETVDVASDAEELPLDELGAGPAAAAEEFRDDAAADDAGVEADLEALPSPAPEIAAEAVAGGPAAAPPSDDLPVLTNEQELARFANDKVIADRRAEQATTAAADVAEESPDSAESVGEGDDTALTLSPTLPPTLPPPVDLCGLVDELVGFAFWEGGLFDEPVAVGIDSNSNDAVAYRFDDCAEIARTPLPPIDGDASLDD